MMPLTHYPTKQHCVFKEVSNKEIVNAANNKYEFSLGQRQNVDHGSVQMSKTREIDLHQRSGQKLEPDRLSSLHENLHKEADKIRKWKANTELEIKQKAPNTFQDTLGKIEQFRLLSSMERIKEALQDKKIQEATTTIECLRKSILELQLENESLSLKLEEEMSTRTDIQRRINTTREICAYVKEHSLSTDSILQKCKEEREELKTLQEEQQQQFENLLNKFKNLETGSLNEQKELIDQLSKEKEKNMISERNWTEKFIEAELKLKDLMYLCDEKDIEIRDIRTVVNKNEDKIHDLNYLLDNLQSQLSSTQENLNQTENRLVISEENLSSSKADLGMLEKKVKEVTEHHLEKVASEKALQEKIESLGKAREADLKAFSQKADLLKKTITDDKQRIHDLGALLERTDNAVEELKSARDILIMEKSEMESKIHQLMDEKEDVNQLKKEIAHSEEHNQQLLVRVLEMEGQLKEDRGKSCKTERELRESEEEISKLQAHIEKRDNSIKKLQLHLEEEERNADKLRSAVEDKKEAIERVSQLQKKLDDQIKQNEDLLSAGVEQDKTLHGEIESLSKEKERLQAMTKSLKADNTLKVKQIKELEKEAPHTFQDTLGKIEQFRLLSSMERIKEALQIRSLKSKTASQSKANEEKNEELEDIKSKLKRLSEGKEAVEKEKSELKSQISEEKKSTKKAIKEAEYMKKEVTKMEKEKAALTQNCDLQIKEMTDMLAKYQNENTRVINQKDKEIQSLKQSVKEFEETRHKEDEFKKNAQLTPADFEEDGISKAKELEELRKKFEEVTTKDVVSTSIQTSPVKNVQEEITPLLKQSSNIQCTPQVPVNANQSVFRDRVMNNYLPTTPKGNLTQKTYETPKSLNKPSMYVTPSRSVMNTPQRSILRASCNSSVLKKRRVAFASDKDTASDAESSASEMMEFEVREIDLRYKDRNQNVPLHLKPSPMLTPSFSIDDFEEEKENRKENTLESTSSLSLNYVPRGSQVSKKQEEKAQNIRKAPAKQQGKFFKNSPKERIQKSKLSSFKKKDESWFDLDAVFGFED